MHDLDRLSGKSFGLPRDVDIAGAEELERDCRRSRLASTLMYLCSVRQRMARICLQYALRLEGGGFYSATGREILRTYYDVRVGAYSYGECMRPGAWPAGTTVGRYVSVAKDVRVFRRNHPIERLSLHPFFYNTRLEIVTEETIASSPLFVGHDAWLGERAIVTPGCGRIGIGAIVGAGAVVTKDVADFTIVAGNPAKPVRERFPKNLQASILASRWWERSVADLKENLEFFQLPLAAAYHNNPQFLVFSANRNPGLRG